MEISTKPIKICFIAPKAYPLFNPDLKEHFGGAEVDLYLIATELAKGKDYEVSFVTADYGQERTEVIKGCKVIKSLDFKKNPLCGAVRVWKAMRAADAQIYFHETVTIGTFLVALFCKLHKRIFIYRTASQWECDGTYLNDYFFAGKLFRWSLRNAAQVVVQNDTDQKALKQTTGVDSVVIPNGQHLPPFYESSGDTILWVGRSVDVKRPQLFVDLAEKIPDEKFEMVCQRAVGDNQYEELVARAKGIKNLEFVEHVPFCEIGNYFRRAKVFVNTSKYEGFPNTFIEACKLGTPILSLNVNPDGFLEKYGCGRCANDNWDKFVEFLKQMLKTEEISRYGKNARKYAQQHHDIEKIMEDYKMMFSSTI